jgi:hypothetical protein
MAKQAKRQMGQKVYSTESVDTINVDSAGNVGIGTTSPTQKFHVNGSVLVSDGSGGSIYIGGIPYTGNGYRLHFSGTNVYNDFDGSLFYRNTSETAIGVLFQDGTLCVSKDAKGGVAGSNENNAKLQINGWVAASAYVCRAGQSGGFNNLFNISWTGSPQLWIDATNVGTFAFTSDYRVKKNIKTQTQSAIERIAQLRPVQYEFTNYKELFKADGVQREGFIAHELQEIIPSAVEGEKDAENQIQSLKLDALCSVMVKAIQEQQTIIESMKAELAELKAK